MKKESVFIAVLLISVTLAFSLGIKYQQNAALTGEAIFEKKTEPLENQIERLTESIENIRENISTFNDYLVGGGSESIFNESNSTYSECISWGNSSCQNNEIKCPEQYKKITLSDYNNTKSERLKTSFVCVKSETINNTKRKISFDNMFRDSIFLP